MVGGHDRAGDVLALGFSLGLGLLGVWSDVVPGGVDAGEAFGLVLGAAALASIFWRRRWPELFTVAAVLAGAWSPLAGYVGLVGVYTVAVHRRWPTTVAVSGMTMALSAVSLRFEVRDPSLYLPLVVAAVTLTVAAAAWGMYVSARRELLASLRERAERAEAEQALRAERARTAERRRIAREMHDVLGHRLSLLSVHAGALELRADLPAEAVTRTAGMLRETARAAMDDLREIVLVLREPAGEPGDDAADGPQPRLADVPDLVAQSRDAGAVVDLTNGVPAATPPEHLGRTAYRVVQEGLTNARRHAAGAPVSVEVSGRPGTELSVRVVSGPATRRTRPAERGSGTGLVGLRERVALAGGELAHGMDGAGRHVLSARMPWPADDHAAERPVEPEAMAG